jgi:ABC-type Mn2+/Zn2+ transport system permease subunit
VLLASLTSLSSALIAAGALGIACSVLSVFVVTKRWAFIGEGIAHAGFGGAGTAWMLALLFPSVTLLAQPATIYAISVAFSAAVAIAVATLSRAHSRNRVTGASSHGGGGGGLDTVVGIFLVASLAWGFLAYGLYSSHTHRMPPQFAEYLGFEHLQSLSPTFVLLAVVVSAAVLVAVNLTWKELLFYGTDEAQAEASGVNVPLIHYGLILLITLVIMVGMRLMGTVLVVALLVLPGATGLQLARTTRSTWLTSAATGLTATLAGPLISHQYPSIPEGPAIVLTLFTHYLLALAASKLNLIRIHSA